MKDTHNRTPHDNESSIAATCLEEIDGYYICPEDATNPTDYAKSAIEQYTQFCQGEVYGVCVWTYTRSTTDAAWELDEDDRDECWGFYGDEYAAQSLKEAFDNHVAAIKPQQGNSEEQRELWEGTEGQDRESYTDDQDRENYTL